MRRDSRRQPFRNDRISDTLPHLVSPEIVSNPVEPFISPDFCEVAEPGYEPALGPVLFVHRLDLFRTVSGGAGPCVVVEVVFVCAEGARSLRILLRHPLLQLQLRRGIELTLSHRKCHVRRSLKHGEMRHDRAQLLNHLNAGGTGADHPDPFAG